MFTNWLTRLEKVSLAHSRWEQEAIYGLRYKVYVEELAKKNPSNVDHERQWIKDPGDSEPGTVLLYSGSMPNLSGTLRLTTWQPGQIPEEVVERYSLELFPDYENLTICEAARLVVRSNFRGKLILPSLARACYETVCRKQNVHLAFLYCAPGLVRVYRRLGFRPYSGRLVSTKDGIRVPLLMIPSDLRYFREVNSPLSCLAKEIFGQGGRGHLNIKPYLHLLQADAAQYQLDAEYVWTRLETDFLQRKHTGSTFLQDLAPADLKLLSSKGFILEVTAGETVTREELVEKEVFLILEGSFEAMVGHRRLAILNKGDVFGEEAFFLESGRRTSTIRSLTPGRVIVLRRRFIQEIGKTNPALEACILFNLGRVMAMRLSEMISSIDPQTDTCGASSLMKTG
ncbi:N-acyl amino acid synthase FeeM domain-containing protein [Dethiosulfatarculus sandiegensis]|uniref:Cyclic nucleotide-binding domain-containing protein n=1 Tax=Dethiosulfatarculus sandiegensis TaxID=1429043 RepID=A0A0D2J2Z8_9BACT|nr:cyclic nucleotide-binding domain-containing protein [Dethiosulfatarculus sandiegensis]KIX12534.1 hypothetical protein X474_18190 [Dethiosulfatarculus sandiegensis]